MIITIKLIMIIMIIVERDVVLVSSVSCSFGFTHLLSVLQIDGSYSQG